MMPFSAVRTRMNASKGNGSRVMPRPISKRSRTMPPPPLCPEPAEPGLSHALLGGYPAGFHRVDQGLVVTFVLVGVGRGELGDRAVEDGRAAQVGGDGDTVAGAGVRPGQGP